MKIRQFSVSVTDLAAFCCRSGSLDAGLLGASAISLSQGQEGQRRIQAKRGPHYEKEIAVKLSTITQHCQWQLSGRIDGLQTAPKYQVEEIKTTGYTQLELPTSNHALHLAQAKLYGAILLKENSLTELELRITYYHFHSEQEYSFTYTYSDQEFTAFLEDCISRYSQWLDQYCCYLATRNLCLQQLEFPFQQYREGQRGLSVQTYRDMRDGKQAIYHAPTGLGKTAGILFPALKNLAQGHIKQIWYLTAKTSGQNSVHQAIDLLRKQKLKLKILVLKAKEKQCYCDAEARQDAQPCPFQAEYFDRLQPARMDFQNSQHFFETDFQQLAQQYQLCPHQLSRDLLPWADLIIADYNYVFDPCSRLNDYLAQSKSFGLLIDESHNLPDRAREMYTESLSRYTLLELKQQVDSQKLKRKLQQSLNRLDQFLKTEQQEDCQALQAGLMDSAQQTMEWFNNQNWLLFPTDLFEHCFNLQRFAQRMQSITEEDHLHTDKNRGLLQIICIDPAPRLEEISHSFHSAHYFSGSLLPFPYFQRALQSKPFSSEMVLASPFPSHNQCTIIYPINTRYEQRERSIKPLCQLIEAVWQQHPGRYLITFSSYEYLETVYQTLQQHNPQIPAERQPQSNQEKERNHFLQKLKQEQIIGFAISGGLFAEGLDLGKDKLDGVIIVGTCLPPPSDTRNLMQHYFSEHSQNGFDFAYRYPGMNRVIQSAGRVIRSETDRGLVILADDRFTQNNYRQLMPNHWQPNVANSLEQLQRVMAEFLQTDV